MKLFIKVSFIFVLSFLFIQTASAEKTEHYKLAETLIEQGGSDYIKDVAVESIVFNVVLQQPELIFYVDVLNQFYSSLYRREDLKNDFITVYTNNFTKDELKEIVDFQKTPTGQKFLQEMTKISKQLGDAYHNKKMELLPELDKMIADKQKQIQSLKNMPVFTVPELLGNWSITWVDDKSTNQVIIFTKGSDIKGTYVNDSGETCNMLGVVNNAGHADFSINCPSWKVMMQGNLSNDKQVIEGYSLAGTIIERFIMSRNK